MLLNFMKAMWITMWAGLLLHQADSSESVVKQCEPPLDKCKCTVDQGSITQVTCIDTGFIDAASIFKHIPTTVKTVKFSGNIFKELPSNLFGTCTGTHKYNDLKVLDLSGNEIHTIHGKTFHCMPNVETLILDENDWFVDKHTLVFSNLVNLQELSLQKAFAEDYNETITHITKLKWVFKDSKLYTLNVLHLERNDLFIFEADIFCDLKSLKKLYLDSNFLALPSFDYGNEHCMREITTIGLTNNLMSEINKELRTFLNKRKNVKVDFSNNPFSCNCDFPPSHDWLLANRVKVFNVSGICCNSPSELKNQLVIDVPVQQMVCKPVDMDSRLRASYIIIGVTLTIVGVLFVVIMYLNRNKVKLQCREHILEPIVDTVFRERAKYTSVNI